MIPPPKIFAVIGRGLLMGVAVLFILISILGMAGIWYVDRMAVGMTNQVFMVVESGISVSNSGGTTALNKIKGARSELAQIRQDITTLGSNLKENHPVLVALSERAETRLAPSVDGILSVLEPVREGLSTMDAVLAVANSLPYFQESAPGLQELQNSLQDLVGLQADVQQLRTTLQAAAEGKADSLTDETTGLLIRLIERADERLVRIQENLETLLEKIMDLQARTAKKRAEILFVLNLTAFLITLLFLWVIYSQIVVIRVQIANFRQASTMLERLEALASVDQVTMDISAVNDRTEFGEVGRDPESSD